MNNTRYNPVTAAAKAAWTELTTPEAYEFYDRGWTAHNRAMLNGAIATLEFVIDSAEGWHTAGKFAYQLGIMARAWFDTFVQETAPVQSSMLLCAAPCAGYLPEVSSADRPVLVTPAPVTAATTDRGSASLGDLLVSEVNGAAPTAPMVNLASVLPSGFEALSVAELRKLCSDRNLSTRVNSRRLNRKELINLLLG